MKILKIPLETRKCECCGGNDLESVCSNQSVVSKASSSYLFNISTVICKRCGFCFSSPVYKREFLSKYYADGFSRCKDIMLPYSIEPRLACLKKYSVPDGIMAEIGGDQADEFHYGLSGFFKQVINIELTSDSGDEYHNINDIPWNFIDVITHYDVLEHVPRITEFLTTCYSVLKKDGLMICEVPNIRLYPRNLLLYSLSFIMRHHISLKFFTIAIIQYYVVAFIMQGYILEYEHVNHFSSLSLSTIAAKCGFALLELGHLCSRPFGFVAAFRKMDIPAENQKVDLPFEFLDARSCIQGAIRQIEYAYENIKIIQQSIKKLADQGKKITIWCVTDLLYRLIENYELPANAIVVDTDPRRKTHLENYGLEVYQPKP